MKVLSEGDWKSGTTWLATRPRSHSTHTTSFNEFVHKRQVLCFGDWADLTPYYNPALTIWEIFWPRSQRRRRQRRQLPKAMGHQARQAN